MEVGSTPTGPKRNEKPWPDSARQSAPMKAGLWKPLTCTMYAQSSFGRTTWPRRATRRTDDFLSKISITMNRLRDCAAYLNTYLKEVSH